jgi:hypothetical protein
LEAQLGGKIGVAVSGLGVGQHVERAGSLRSLIAWSTSKVPVAMAVVAAGLGQSQRNDHAAAITAYDNAAAERLWAALGGGVRAAQAADAQLRTAGDTRTQMQWRRLRAGLTEFGQTLWSLSDQARFAAGMSCTGPGSAIMRLMGQVVAGQRWGLGQLPGARFKGGWGPGSQPGANGGYVERQFGIINVGGRSVAVAIAAEPADGTDASGRLALNEIANWVARHADVRVLPRGARCAG